MALKQDWKLWIASSYQGPVDGSCDWSCSWSSIRPQCYLTSRIGRAASALNVHLSFIMFDLVHKLLWEMNRTDYVVPAHWRRIKLTQKVLHTLFKENIFESLDFIVQDFVEIFEWTNVGWCKAVLDLGVRKNMEWAWERPLFWNSITRTWALTSPNIFSSITKAINARKLIQNTYTSMSDRSMTLWAR